MTTNKRTLPAHFLPVERASWSEILELRKKGVPWDELRTRTGLSALGMAIFEGSALAVQMVLEMGAPISSEKLFDGSVFSPLWSALERKKPYIIDILLQAGADPNEQHPYYGTPIAFAAEHVLLEETLILCKHGAIPNTPTAPSPLWLWIKNTVPTQDQATGDWIFPERNPILPLLKNGARVHGDEKKGVGMNELQLARKMWWNIPLKGESRQNMIMTISLMEKNLYSQQLLRRKDESDEDAVQKREHKM